MPFTTSHPAIVIPLKKMFPNYLSLTGLMAGAMSPDLLYFLNLTTLHRGFSHSWPGLFLFCVPAGIIFSYVFHRLIKYNLIMNLPSPLDRKYYGLAVSEFHPTGFWRIISFVTCVMIGALSHFFWDSFTHQSGEIALMLPFLREYSVILGRPVANAAIAQHLSTIFGFLYIVWALFKGNIIPSNKGYAVRYSSDIVAKLRFWAGIVGFAVFFAFTTVWVFERLFPYHPVAHRIIFGLAGWAGVVYGIAGYTICQKIFKNSREITEETGLEAD